MEDFNYRFLGAGIGHCAGILGCDQAPDLVKDQLNLSKCWQKTVYFKGIERGLNALNKLADFSHQLALETANIIEANRKFITVGGDHSCAIGTWSGVYKALGDFGLIWIDAHMDAHTPESSHSGNLHGMVTSTLLGYGDKKLTCILSEKPKIKPEHIVLIGIRSFEKEEQALLEKLNVKVFMIEEVKAKGFDYCFNEALHYFSKQNLSFGISFDLDGIDPGDINALGTPVENGIALKDILICFKKMSEDRLIGIEIAEYNPMLDIEHQGIRVIHKILQAVTAYDVMI